MTSPDDLGRLSLPEMELFEEVEPEAVGELRSIWVGNLQAEFVSKISQDSKNSYRKFEKYEYKWLTFHDNTYGKTELGSFCI